METGPAAIRSCTPSHATVLVVDDAPSVLALNAVILRREGYRVLTTESAVDAALLMARDTPDVIVLDYMLPVMDGPMFLRQLRADPRFANVGVIVLTASNQERHVEEAFAAGGDDFLTKPVDRRILVARVKALLETRRARSRAAAERDVAEERDALLREVADAKQIQSARLPSFPVKWNGWRLEGMLQSCGHVGGDLSDVIDQGPSAKTFALLDVCGHGLAAAMVATSVRSALRLLVRELSAERAVAALNLHLCQLNDLYVCIALVQVAEDTITIVNAGLPPVAVVDDGAVTALIGPNGAPPGLFEDSTYDSVCVERRPGMRLVVISDGVTEPFGLSDCTEATVERLGLLGASPTSAELEARVRGLLSGASSAHADDATLLVLSDERGPPTSRGSKGDTNAP